MLSLQDASLATGMLVVFCGVLRYVIRNDTATIVNGKLEKVRTDLGGQIMVVRVDLEKDITDVRNEMVSRAHYASGKLQGHELQLAKVESRAESQAEHIARVDTHVNFLDGRVVNLEKGRGHP